jgi:hypothetical protein
MPRLPTIQFGNADGLTLDRVVRKRVEHGALQDRIRQMRESLEHRGIRTAFFTTRLPLPTMCLWTNGQRARLLRRTRFPLTFELKDATRVQFRQAGEQKTHD